jgi:hypothetical protein
VNPAKGNIGFIETGDTFYLKPDSKWWATVAGPGGAGVGQLLRGRYLIGPISGTSAQATACQIIQVAASANTMAGHVAKGQVSSVDGQRVLALNGPGGEVVQVTDTSKPEITQVFDPKPDKGGYSGTVNVNVGARVTVDAPLSSQSVDASDFGVTSTAGISEVPLESLSDTMMTSAFANMKAAQSLTIAGSGTESGQSYSLDLGFKPRQGCAGTIGYGTQGSIKFTVKGTTIYFKPDNTFWETQDAANAASIISTQNGRYIETSTSNTSLKDFVQVCDLYQSVGPSNPVAGVSTAAMVTPLGGYDIGQVTTLDGIPVLPLKDSSGGVVYVSDTGRLEVVKTSQDKAGSGGTYGAFTFNVGAPVTLTAPPASQVLAGSTLGY